MSASNEHNEAVEALTASTPSGADVQIDPALLYVDCLPARRPDGSPVSESVYKAHLLTIKKQEPLRAACTHLQIRVGTRSNLEFLRSALIRHCYPIRATANPPPAAHAAPGQSKGPSIVIPPGPSHATQSFGVPASRADQEALEADVDVDDDTLAKEYDVGGIAESIFGALDTGGLEDEDEDEELEEFDDLDDDATYVKFQTNVRVSAAQRTEANRRSGGRKTQISIIKSWNVFLKDALATGKIRDDIVDEHALLLFIDFCAGRCKRNRRGEYIPNTRIGASQIKKEFFGALRIRKVQDARDPTLATKRPSTTVHVYDAVKTRMDEALQNAREGLIPAEDAPDIIANTFLAQLSDETLTKIRYGFLDHREVKPTINGHLAWTMMNASGNRGDDIRALRLCEMQPYQFLHPNGETTIPAVLGLQSDMEQKARSKGMKTTINPTYTCFIAHRNPEMCPLGAFGLYLHYIHDVASIDENYDVDYTVNKSWRSIRLIHGSSATAPYNETALQNLFCQSYKKAGVESNLKAHLARHMLGYHQEKMGCSRDTYQNTYAPALPKPAILGAHGYRVHETYNPAWTQVEDPLPFLALVCPMAEANVQLVKGLKDRVGATNYWEMVISLRPYLFQAAAAIFQVRPNSKIFRLPALARDDVQPWMRNTFPIQLATIDSNVADPVNLERLQNEILRKSLEQLRQESSLQNQVLRNSMVQIEELKKIIHRRTLQWTPAKAIPYNKDYTSHQSSGVVASVSRQLEFQVDACYPPSAATNLEPAHVIDSETRASEDTGVYCANDDSLRGFVVPSPSLPTSPRPRTEVDLVLPPVIAFCAPGEDLLMHHPVLGQGSIQWNDVFTQIKQPGPLWDTWKPSRTLDQMSVQDVWDCYNVGESVQENGRKTGVKPPLRLVEQKFGTEWRKEEKNRKAWQRFREIPEWIDIKIKSGFNIAQAMAELEEMRCVPGKLRHLGTSALAELLATNRKAAAKVRRSEKTKGNSASNSGGSDNGEVVSTATGSKRRAPTVGGRPKPKKSRIHS
ncbi:hypothetical protein GALMADRAFT_230698 [Galerina marginata CBS 339.88]|uniref:Transcription activator GCR1-like domain-containing protein n=1 Tax=Galerina marginata (strain CBS 339.88) TaxID=685588 RepID=A0A067SRZ1_GALM3|nr:hypothetical protein GALMADRAFT_230698 [Galerina marginata CBS 339.88]